MKPTHKRGQETDAERSYQHVMQAFEDALSTPMALPPTSADRPRPRDPAGSR